jgi:hypothetical protein
MSKDAARYFAAPRLSAEECPVVNSVSSGKVLLTRFEDYLKGALHPIPEEAVVAKTVQSFFSWFFSLLRNALICGLLQYLSDVSGSIPLKLLAIISYIMLATYCLSYINIGVLTPFHFVKHKRLGNLLDGLVTIGMILSVISVIGGGMWFSINEIAKGHAASRINPPRHSTSPSPALWQVTEKS